MPEGRQHEADGSRRAPGLARLETGVGALHPKTKELLTELRQIALDPDARISFGSRVPATSFALVRVAEVIGNINFESGIKPTAKDERELAEALKELATGLHVDKIEGWYNLADKTSKISGKLYEIAQTLIDSTPAEQTRERLRAGLGFQPVALAVRETAIAMRYVSLGMRLRFEGESVDSPAPGLPEASKLLRGPVLASVRSLGAFGTTLVEESKRVITEASNMLIVQADAREQRIAEQGGIEFIR